ncbi:T9SS type B sorting domain-containing protein [Flavobacterium pallidum]|uniref:Fibronectin type-III domain-containing protein n=1 Tax=Flavobacterium pallidum TaxID=2172098 RepID=A0A2S1SFS5_9FLAO|nr:gliding motility-associated C-terminal domain-containing protein [Flavobacterium pallidum]AWI25202.1 hypothetical protein HYN49_04440 [Flavobacterium pallidum]
MKKIILLFTFLMCSALGFSQLETFEGGIPSTWAVMNGTNGVGNLQPWILNTTPWPLPTSQRSPYPAHNDTTPVPTLNAAYVNNEQIGMGNTEEDWLIMNQRLIPANGQLQFWTRLTQVNDQGTIYEIRVSTNPTQTNQAAYTVLTTWGEDDIIDPTIPLDQYQQVKVDFPTSLQGQNVYVAFVRKFTQPTGQRAGDRWLIDDVNIVEKCADVSGLDVIPASIASTHVTFTWNNPQLSTNFEIGVIPAADDFNNVGTPVTVAATNPATYAYSGAPLQPSQTFKVYVRRVCGSGTDTTYSEWQGPFIFTTLPLGSVCIDPLPIDVLPYQELNDNTALYGDEYDTPQQASGCGTVTPLNTNYLQGNEVFYSYTNSGTDAVDINVVMTPLGNSPNSSVFIYDGCIGNGGTCVNGLANITTNVRNLTFNALAGHTYTIIISSSTTQTIAYGLLVQELKCTPMPSNLAANPVTTTNAHLTWDALGYTSWQVAVQPLGSEVPSGAGVPVANNEYDAPVTAATQYQYWVRAECAPGSDIWTGWAGPFPFNSDICTPDHKCNYVFRLGNNGAGGWGNDTTGTRMQIRQNGIVIATLGSQFTAPGPVDVIVPICEGIPFDVFWKQLGASSQQRQLTIINNHGQTIYTRPAVVGVVNTVIYNDEIAECDTPRCDLTPINVTIPSASITTTGATINWTAIATSSWDVYITPIGSPAPDADTVPTYDNITPATTSFTTTNPLQPDHCYNVYVRVNCSPVPSAWSALTANSTFCTLPTCQKPTNPIVAVQSTTAATFTWTPALPDQTDFEILLIPGPTAPSPAPDNATPATYPIITVPVGGPYTFTATDLTPATIYYGYVRAVCSPTDASIWVPFAVFNSITCEPENKCIYKFVLTDIGTNGNGNGWGATRMQVRQNGIIIQELNLPSGSTSTVQVPLCDGVPFDIYWNVAGANPEQVGVSVQNPFLDVLYTKAPGTGTPLTVLFDSVVECSPAPCSKPTNIDVATATILPHSAVITWVDNSNPPSDGYELYVVPTGQPAPTNNPPTPANVTGITGTSYTLTQYGNPPVQLSASTSYTFYIRAVCPGSQVSNWTILTPTTFITTPENNECAFATSVTVNTGNSCAAANMANGNTYGANASNPTVDNDMTGAGCDPTAKDVWYKFVATATSQTIVLSDIVPTPATPNNFKLSYSVFSGSCAGLTRMFCSTSNTNGGTGFIPGNTYYIRVYNASTSSATQSATFHLCVLTPPTNDECTNATPVTVNTTQTCNPANTVSANTYGSTASNPVLTPPLAGTGCGPASNDVWFSFVAVAPTQIINFSNIVTTPANASNLKINYSVFSGSCGALTNLFCSVATASIATGLTVGNTYYIRAYIAPSNSEQSATFDLCITSPPANDECTAAVTVPVNAGQYCDAVASGNTLGATPSNPVLSPVLPTTGGCGPTNNDVWYSFTATSETHMISLSNVVPTPATATTLRLNYSVFSGSCTGLTKLYCSTNYISMASGLIPGNVYYIRVYTSTPAVDTSATFDLCITSPPSNNECANAISVTPNTGQDCAPVNTVSGYTHGATPSLPNPPVAGTGCLQLNSDMWYSFTATSTSHAITLSNLVLSPSNSTAKLNYTVFSGTCDNLTKLYCSTTNSTNATGLTIGNTYYVRIYSTLTAVDQSIKFDLCITSPPVNDDCANAIDAPINSTAVCTTKSYGNTLGATPSTPTITGAGCTGTNDDVWYKFTATNPILFINVNTIFASTGSVALNHTVFSGTCDALTTMYCSNSTTSVATGLTVGNVYYIRIYTAGTTVGDWATFSLCIKTPPPPAENEDCSSALPVTVNLNNDCYYTTQGNLIEAGPSASPVPNTPACVGNANDDVWFSFVAAENQHFINLLAVEGTTTNLNHAVYSGTCGNLTRLYCSDTGQLSSTDNNFIPGETYYIRVWSNAATSQVVIFNVCVKSVSTCETAAPFCGSQDSQSLLFPNTTEVPSPGQLACLATAPNPTYYYLQVAETGNLTFEIRQSTNPNNFPTNGAPGLDVDFVAWGPFASPGSCNEIAFEDCPSCPNNQDDANFYPEGNIVDCSYSADVMETLHIPNAVAGEYYLLLITNFNGDPGYIKLFQSNFGQPGTGVSTNLCCDVAAGDDKIACGSITLNAIEESQSSPASYQWYIDGSIIPGAESANLIVDTPGLHEYKVVGFCGLNTDTDIINVTVLPAIGATTPADYVLCDGDDHDGQAPFDLFTLTEQVLVGLTPSEFDVTYHLTAAAAANDDPGIDISTLFVSPTQTIYVRVERILLPTCYEVIPVNLVVTDIVDATITYETDYCSDAGTISPLTVANPGLFSVSGGLTISQSGVITLTGNEEGQYTITNVTQGACSDTKNAVINIVRRHTAGFDYGPVGTLYCEDGDVVSPHFTGTFSQAGNFTVVAGDGNLALDPVTGQIILGSSDAGEYTIKNEVNNGTTCSGDEATATITIVEAASGSIVYSNGPFCKDVTSVSVQNNVTPVSSEGTYSVDIPGLSIDADGTIHPNTSQANDYVVTYTLDIDGCGIYTTQANVKIIPESDIEFTAECSGNDFVITALPVNGSFDPALVTYHWTGGTSVAGTALGSIIAKAAPATYTVEVVADGCSTFASIVIDDISCIIQRGISPNNDTKNDSFDLTTLNVKHLSIFNRYGTVVYEYTNYTNQWVGQDNSGDELPDGTYFYVIDKADGEQRTGWVYINR